MHTALSAFVVAFVASTSLTVPVRRLALRLEMVDRPGSRKLHLTPIPLLGGLAIYCGAVMSVTFFVRGPARAQILGILAGATLLAVVGILDDRGLLHHQVKLFVGMPIAALILIASGVKAEVVSALWPGFVGSVPDKVVTLFWVVGITAAFSILDHMDGLCAGTAAIASAFFMLLSILNGQVLVSTLAGAVFGASLGFLGWNFNPAKIFMGDGGAMFLGFMMSTLGLKLRVTGLSEASRWMVPVLILGIPIFDTTLVTVSRSRRRLLPFASPGKDHTAHRLANLGLGQRGAVIVIYVLGCLFGFLAVLSRHLSSWQALGLMGGVIAASVAGIMMLERPVFEGQRKLGGAN